MNDTWHGITSLHIKVNQQERTLHTSYMHNIPHTTGHMTYITLYISQTNHGLRNVRSSIMILNPSHTTWQMTRHMTLSTPNIHLEMVWWMRVYDELCSVLRMDTQAMCCVTSSPITTNMCEKPNLTKHVQPTRNPHQPYIEPVHKRLIAMWIIGGRFTTGQVSNGWMGWRVHWCWCWCWCWCWRMMLALVCCCVTIVCFCFLFLSFVMLIPFSGSWSIFRVFDVGYDTIRYIRHDTIGGRGQITCKHGNIERHDIRHPPPPTISDSDCGCSLLWFSYKDGQLRISLFDGGIMLGYKLSGHDMTWHDNPPAPWHANMTARTMPIIMMAHDSTVTVTVSGAVPMNPLSMMMMGNHAAWHEKWVSRVSRRVRGAPCHVRTDMCGAHVKSHEWYNPIRVWWNTSMLWDQPSITCHRMVMHVTYSSFLAFSKKSHLITAV